MGNTHSDRATHFSRWDPPDEEPEETEEEHHISISNKMVERLVEDASVAEEAAREGRSVPREDSRDRALIDKLRAIDEKHSERLGLTLENLSNLANRIELRSAALASLEPVCPEHKQMVVDCYQMNASTGHQLNCWDVVDAFSKCVRDASGSRLTTQWSRAEREAARRTRRLARARDHVLRDYVPRNQVPPI